MIPRLQIIREVVAALNGYNGSGPIAMPHDGRAIDLVIAWTELFTKQGKETTPDERMAYARKFASFIIRTGFTGMQPPEYLLATLWYTAHPGSITSKLSFASAAQCQKTSIAEYNNKVLRAQQKRLDEELSDPETMPETILDTQTYRLERLTHGNHLIRAGLKAGNCLAHITAGKPYPNFTYLRAIKDGREHLFTLSDGDKLLFVVAVAEGEIQELEFIRPRSEVEAILPRCADAIAARIGPFSSGDFDHQWPCPREIEGPFPAGTISARKGTP